MEETTKKLLHNIMQIAEPLKVEGCTGFKKLAEFNSIILAAKESPASISGYEFVTWLQRAQGDYCTGNYMYDYENAKINFLLRSELVNPDVYNELMKQHLYDQEINQYISDQCKAGIISSDEAKYLLLHMDNINSNLNEHLLVASEDNPKVSEHLQTAISNEIYDYLTNQNKMQSQLNNLQEEQSPEDDLEQ